MKIINYNQCGKNFAKGFNLKVYRLNVMKQKRSVPNLMLMNQLMTTWKMEMIGTLKITKFKCKICKKEIIGKYNIKVHMENVHKEF